MRKFVNFIIFVYFGVNAACSRCPNGWTRYEDSCYLFVDDLYRSWSGARTYCKNVLHGDIAVPETVQENYFLKTYLQKLYRKCNAHDAYYWFGGSDIVTEGRWVAATDGHPFLYRDWAPNEPQGYRRHNCAGYYGFANFTWDDALCNGLHHFICEMHANILSPTNENFQICTKATTGLKVLHTKLALL